MQKLLWVIPCPECGFKYRLFDAQSLGLVRDCPACHCPMLLQPPRDRTLQKSKLDAIAAVHSGDFDEMIGPEQDDRASLEVADHHRTDSAVQTPPEQIARPPQRPGRPKRPAEGGSSDPFSTDDAVLRVPPGPGEVTSSLAATPKDFASAEESGKAGQRSGQSESGLESGGTLHHESPVWIPPAVPRRRTPVELPAFSPSPAAPPQLQQVDEETIDLPPLGSPLGIAAAAPDLRDSGYLAATWQVFVPSATGLCCGLAAAVLLFRNGPAWLWFVFAILGLGSAACFQWLRSMR